MRLVIVTVLVLHALLHGLGFAKGFGLAALPALTVPISRGRGVLWLTAGLVLLVAATLFVLRARPFFAVAALGVVLSQIAIVLSFRDARAGTLPNVLLAACAVWGAFSFGPFGLRAEYDARAGALSTSVAPPITEAELAPLPELVQKYLRFVGVVGRPHVRTFHATFRGRIRSGPDAPWMELRGEQTNAVEPTVRLFFLDATMKGLPVDGLHAYAPDGARMRVRLLSLLPVAGGSGLDFTRTETVTVLNDLCLMAPGALVDRRIAWKPIDARTVEATFTQGPHTVRATLLFDERGALVNFWSDDRPALAPDGRTFLPQRWSTPVGDYRLQGGLMLASRGEARYAAPTGEYAYIQFDDLSVTVR